MNIILTSTGFMYETVTNKIKNLINKPFSEIKMLVIPTARKFEYIQEEYIQDYLRLGFKADNIIFFNDEHANDYANLDIDLIYVCGGNTFLLQKYLTDTNFDIKIKKYIQKGVIYLGASAGTHIATSSIKHVSYFDSNDVNVINYNTLNILDGIVICHYDETREELYNKLTEENDYPVYTLSNYELLHYDGTNITKI